MHVTYNTSACNKASRSNPAENSCSHPSAFRDEWVIAEEGLLNATALVRLLVKTLESFNDSAPSLSRNFAAAQVLSQEIADIRRSLEMASRTLGGINDFFDRHHFPVVDDEIAPQKSDSSISAELQAVICSHKAARDLWDKAVEVTPEDDEGKSRLRRIGQAERDALVELCRYRPRNGAELQLKIKTLLENEVSELDPEHVRLIFEALV